MSLKLVLPTALLLLPLLLSCDGGGDYAQSESMASEPTTDAKMVSSRDEVSNDALPEKKLIRRAEMRMEVADYEKALEQVRAQVEAHEAEITKESEQQYGSRLENQLTLRMPPQQLEPLMESLAKLAAYVDRRSVEVEDVTRQYIDLETRLSSKREVLKRYRELLKEAKNVQEVLTVEEKLRRLVEEIESTEGQFRYLQQQVGRSTLRLTLYEQTREGVAQRSFGSRMLQALVRGWQLLQNLVLGLLAAWPVLLVLGVFIVWWWRRRRRRR
ncbi:MAG: DUF4349 domain-containing protein [Bacteroidetes bacterium]|jgi:DNA repair exonuclease SbcCD ATPase subunit|nr:DUF4349 domain-containing protein [Bacteroidota bacterium]